MLITASSYFFNNNSSTYKTNKKLSVSFNGRLLSGFSCSSKNIRNSFEAMKSSGIELGLKIKNAKDIQTKELLRKDLCRLKENLRTFFLENLANLENEDDINSALYAFAEVGIPENLDNSKIIEFVLENTYDNMIKNASLYALQSIGSRGDTEVIIRILEILKDVKTNQQTQIQALKTLENVGRGKQVTDFLLSSIENYFKEKKNSIGAKEIRYQLLETLYVVDSDIFEKLEGKSGKLKDKRRRHFTTTEYDRAKERNYNSSIDFSEKNKIYSKGYEKILTLLDVLNNKKPHEIILIVEELAKSQKKNDLLPYPSIISA